jgi:hypothetical protein
MGKYLFAGVFILGLYVLIARVAPAFIMSLGWPVIILASLLVGMWVASKVKL